MQDENDEVMAAAVSDGITACTVSDADYAAFKDIADEYSANWVKDNTTATFDAQKFLDKWNELVAANA